MLRWDKESPVRFKEHYTIQMLEKRFTAEDEGLCMIGKAFRWNQISSINTK